MYVGRLMQTDLVTVSPDTTIIKAKDIIEEKKFPGVYQLVLRVDANDVEKAIDELIDGGFKVLTGYVQDLTPYLPAG